jgi:hypothetical protein
MVAMFCSRIPRMRRNGIRPEEMMYAKERIVAMGSVLTFGGVVIEDIDW